MAQAFPVERYPFMRYFIGVAHVADEVAHEGIALDREGLGHLVLFQLVARKDDQLPGLELLADHPGEGLAERAGAAGDQHRLAVQVHARRAEVAYGRRVGGRPLEGAGEGLGHDGIRDWGRIMVGPVWLTCGQRCSPHP